MTIRRRSMILFPCAVTGGSGVAGIPGSPCGPLGPVMLNQGRREDMRSVRTCDEVQELRGWCGQNGIDGGITWGADWTGGQSPNRVRVVWVVRDAPDIRVQQSLAMTAQRVLHGRVGLQGNADAKSI